MERHEWGCDGPVPKGCEIEFDGMVFDRCPHVYVRRAQDWLNYIFEMHNWREKGIAPYVGSWSEQPNLIVEAVNYVDYLLGIKIEKETKRTK